MSQTGSIITPGQAASTADAGHEQARAEELRVVMARALRDEDLIVSDQVAAAFEVVPRHLFAPGETLDAAYAPHGTVAPKRDSDGFLLSVISAPHIQAMMLEMAGIEPGMRVLEVGSGGYNAALIAELAGPDGQVTTVDIDPDVTSQARACLDAAGYGRVKVVTADAEHGVPGRAPYDRILVTAGSWDIPPAWVTQLSPGGRLIVPLRLRGLTRAVAFEREGEGLVSRCYRLASFVPFRGDGAHADRKVMIRTGVALHADNPGLRVNAPALNAALDAPRLERWTGARYDFPDELGLFITMNSPNIAQLHASQQAIDQGIVFRSALRGVPAMITDDSIAYRISRQVSEDPTEYESGVIAHGPQAESLAWQYVGLQQRWAAGYFRRGTATFRYLPGPAPDPLPQGAVVKRHGVVTVTYP